MFFVFQYKKLTKIILLINLFYQHKLINLMSNKKQIAKHQKYKCYNKYITKIKYIEDYPCPMWKYNNGYFDEAGYKICKIKKKISRALCYSCYAVWKEKNNYDNSDDFEDDSGENSNKKIRNRVNLYKFISLLDSNEFKQLCKIINIKYTGITDNMIRKILKKSEYDLDEIVELIDTSKKYMTKCDNGHIYFTNLKNPTSCKHKKCDEEFYVYKNFLQENDFLNKYKQNIDCNTNITSYNINLDHLKVEGLKDLCKHIELPIKGRSRRCDLMKMLRLCYCDN